MKEFGILIIPFQPNSPAFHPPICFPASQQSSQLGFQFIQFHPFFFTENPLAIIIK
jgi:hypothetical protein